jgi:GNAT superfamily N-acetyltransferase
MGAVGTTTISRERFKQFYDEARPLIWRNWREIAQFPDIPLEVDEAKFEQAEQVGMLRTFVARHEGGIVGYALFLVNTSPHYASLIQALCDVIYVDLETRALGVGLKLLRFAEAELRAEGVRLVWHHQKAAHPALGRVLEHMGYTPAEVNWNKRLDGG